MFSLNYIRNKTKQYPKKIIRKAYQMTKQRIKCAAKEGYSFADIDFYYWDIHKEDITNILNIFINKGFKVEANGEGGWFYRISWEE